LREQGKSVRLLTNYNELLQYLQSLSQGTVFITLGAGTIYKVYEHVSFEPTQSTIS
jgi:UDP-N-acetylmuramate-alanine ligase